jgi:hypothetical protein
MVTQVAIFANDHAIADMRKGPNPRPRAHNRARVNQSLWMDIHYSAGALFRQRKFKKLSRSFQSRNFLELANQDIHRFAGVLV